jgi:hypothetical protein
MRFNIIALIACVLFHYIAQATLSNKSPTTGPRTPSSAGR